MTHKFTVLIEEGEDGYFISEVLDLPGCHTQAKTLDELMKRTKEAISLYLECTKNQKIEDKFKSYIFTTPRWQNYSHT